MSYKILITCPPMLKQIDSFRSVFSKYNFETETPNVVQTMSEEELIKIIPLYDGWIIGDDPATYDVFRAGKLGRLKAAVKWGIGVDNVDFSACKKLSIPITNTPGMFGAEVADLAMCYILGLARDAFYIDREVRNGNWPKPSGISLNNKILGIVGLGDIGLNIAMRAQAHGLKIIGWDPFIKEAPEYIDLHRNFPDEAKRCDFIVFACSLTDDTYYLLNDDTLSFLKHGVRIVNISRGPLIKESSLLKGLKNNIINSAALDVFENEPVSNENDILKYPKCIVGSHNGSNTIEAVNRASNEAIDILYNMLTKGERI